jgi:hypothetical protein
LFSGKLPTTIQGHFNAMAIFDDAILPAKTKIYRVWKRTVQPPGEIFRVAGIGMALQW